ncbi:tetratricopeptide repeat protein [bacterium]|nr:tetratricopeptide repeat protein [bacterium]
MKRFLVLLLIFMLGTSFECSNAVGLSFGKKQTEVQTDEISQQARVLYAQNNIDEALTLLQNKKEAERTAQDWLMMGNIMQDKDKIPEAVYMFNQALNKEPKYYKAHYNLGYIYFIQDKPNMALAEFKKAVKYNPEFAYGYYNIGCVYLKLKNYGSAKYNFFKALDLRANEPNVYYNLAYCYKKLGKDKKAQIYLDLYNKMMEQHEI